MTASQRLSLGTGVSTGARRIGITPADYDVTDMGYETPCFIWRGTLDRNGYPNRVKYQGRYIYPYRLAWQLHNGPIPRGHTIDHLCRTRACVRHDHLEPATHQENCQRADGRLTPNQVHAIRADPRILREVAADHNVSIDTVWKIRTGKTWTNV